MIQFNFEKKYGLGIMVRLLVHGYNLTAIRIYFIFFDLSLPDNHVLMIYSINKRYLFLGTLIGRN